jgi:hypothetical protein
VGPNTRSQSVTSGERLSQPFRLATNPFEQGGLFMARRVTLLFTVALLLACGTFAQVVATQGVASEQYFESPMVLEVPVGLHHPQLWNGESPFAPKDSVSNFVCDGVSVTSLIVYPGRAKKGKLPVTLNFALKNRPGHDKLVSLKFEVLRNGKPAGTAVRVTGVDVEEKRTVPRSAKLQLDEAILREAGDPPILRIEVSTIDN